MPTAARRGSPTAIFRCSYTLAALRVAEESDSLEALEAESARQAQDRLSVGLVGEFVDSLPAYIKTALPDRADGRALLAKLLSGDTLMVHSLDRLGASVQAVDQTMKTLNRLQAHPERAFLRRCV